MTVSVFVSVGSVVAVAAAISGFIAVTRTSVILLALVPVAGASSSDWGLRSSPISPVSGSRAMSTIISISVPVSVAAYVAVSAALAIMISSVVAIPISTSATKAIPPVVAIVRSFSAGWSA